MRGLIFLVVIIPFILLIVSELSESLKETPEHLKTEQQKVVEMLEDFTFNTPAQMEVLLNREHIDNKTRERIKTIVLKTDEEYLPKTQRVPDKADNVIAILEKSLPNGQFGQAKSDTGSFFRMLTANSEWLVYSIETDQGHFSRWERRADVYQATGDGR